MSTALSPFTVRRESMTEQTARAIRESILTGNYRFGQKLRETELSKQMGVSNSVVRGALHILQGEGMVTTKPYCGRTVFDLSPGEASEVRVMRASLEGYAAYLAAKKMMPIHAERLLEAADRFTRWPAPSYSEWVDRELSFHRIVWQATGNEFLQTHLQKIALPSLVFLIVNLEREGQEASHVWEVNEQESGGGPRGHQLLARTIVSGDPEESRQVMILHVLPGLDDAERVERARLFHL
jgi:DNA-binding GntR family transcriptional regulator